MLTFRTDMRIRDPLVRPAAVNERIAEATADRDEAQAVFEVHEPSAERLFRRSIGP